MHRSLYLGLAAVLVYLLAGCPGGDGGGDKASSASTVKAWQGELPLVPGWLGDRLPANALIYQRLPNPLGLVTAPKGSVLDDALGSDAHVRNLIAIREGLVANVLQEFDALDNVHMRIVFEQLRSPVEIAVLGPDDESINLSALVVHRLALSTNDEFESLMAAVSESAPGVELAGPLDGEGFVELTGLPFGVAMHFDADSGRVLALAGPAVSSELLKTRMGALKKGGEHPMYALQKGIDESGQGFFMWSDPKNTMKLGQMFMPPDIWRQMHDSGLDQVDSLAFGWGVANGKGRLRIAAALPDVEARHFIPEVSNSLSVKSVGTPDFVMLLSIPDAEYLLRMEKLMVAAMSDEEKTNWQEGKDLVQRELGLTIDELLGALGPELLVIADDAGDYSALRLRDAALFDRVMAALSARTGTPVKTREIAGQTFYSWYAPSLYSFADLDKTPEEMGPIAILMRMGEQFYWTREGDFIFLAQIPQPLMDRAARGAKTDVAAWLRDTQRHDLSESVFALSTQTRKLPRRLYYLYLETLQELAELARADFDPWSMPTASQLDLPDSGALGLSVNLGNPVVSAEMMFENNPLEGLLSSSGASIAAVGILAAIAIPAYQDYALRAEVGGAFAAVALHKTAIAEFYQSNGRHMNAAEIEQYLPPADSWEDYEISVGQDTGVIEVYLYGARLGGDAWLYFRPQFDNGSVTFLCSTSMEFKYVPKSCQVAE